MLLGVALPLGVILCVAEADAVPLGVPELEAVPLGVPELELVPLGVREVEAVDDAVWEDDGGGGAHRVPAAPELRLQSTRRVSAYAHVLVSPSYVREAEPEGPPHASPYVLLRPAPALHVPAPLE